MGIEEIVAQALENGYLTPAMEQEIGNLCNSDTELAARDYMALDQLMAALLDGGVRSVPQKQFINVMEELVLTEAIAYLARLSPADGRFLDLGDVAAYALNRLPPLYATTEEGAAYQRERAQRELRSLIDEKLEEAVARSIKQPEFFPERQPLGQVSNTDEVLRQISSLLQNYAPEFEV